MMWASFLETVQKQRFEEMEKEIRRQKQDTVQAERRIAELDRIFKRIYEVNLPNDDQTAERERKSKTA